MTQKTDELLRRREQLIELCAAQRADIRLYAGELATPFALADRVYGVVKYLRNHPLALGAAVAAFRLGRRFGFLKLAKHAVARRSVLIRLGELGLVAWRGWRAMRSLRTVA